MNTPKLSNVGVVIIGRNEGERLQICINAISGKNYHIVYVDSNSSDDSVAFVRSQGYDVLELDMSIPFSAGRARNEGYRFLLRKFPNIDFLQFVDGDCEICEGWIEKAQTHLLNQPELAAVCGRRKERYPDKTIYNYLCDIEWNTPIGITNATGGDFLCRKDALIQADGFNPQVIAGEEPELCFRLREQGWQIERLDLDMTLHDADMTTLSQLIKRFERSGHAFAQGFYMHGNSPERYNLKEVVRILFWSTALPIFILFTAIIIGPTGFVLLLIYPLKILQIYLTQLPKESTKVRLAFSASMIFGKFAQAKGIVSFLWKLIRKKDFQIIEYKG